MLPSALDTIFAGMILLCSFTVEGMAGFGSSVLALPFLLYLIGMDQAVLILVTLSLLFSSVICARNWRHIDKKVFSRIVAVAGAGLPVGVLLHEVFPETVMKLIIAAFMIAVGVGGVARKLKERRAGADADLTSALPASPLRASFYYVFLFAGGVIHGAFGIGGPAIIVYATKAIPRKESFRATMSTLWVCLNSVMTAINVAAGRFTSSSLVLVAALVPFVTAGFFLGNFLHNKVSQWWFAASVNMLLVLIGVIFFLTC